jgi:hypothetical protein
VTTPQQERETALAAYRSACAEFDEAQAQWDSFLATSQLTDAESQAAEAAFERLRNANQTRQDAVDSLWVAWRNRPSPA